jgi:hypothetical protein
MSQQHTLQLAELSYWKRSIERRKKALHQVPIYFVSKALTGSKGYYSEMEKICYAIVISTRKIRHSSKPIE